jgi:hypothetical protein
MGSYFNNMICNTKPPMYGVRRRGVLRVGYGDGKKKHKNSLFIKFDSIHCTKAKSSWRLSTYN